MHLSRSPRRRKDPPMSDVLFGCIFRLFGRNKTKAPISKRTFKRLDGPEQASVPRKIFTPIQYESYRLQVGSSLCNLPNEVVCMIVSFLPLSGEATLILTCKFLAVAVGRESWQATRIRKYTARLHSNWFEIKRFQALISKDISNLFAHGFYDHGPAHRLVSRDRLLKVGMEGWLTGHSTYLQPGNHGDVPKLYFFHVQLAMKAWKWSNPEHGLTLDKLPLRDGVISLRFPDHPSYSVEIYTKLKIAGDRLLLKTHASTEVQMLEEAQMATHASSAREKLRVRGRIFCPHERCYDERASSLLFMHHETADTMLGGGGTSTILCRCRYCATEVEFSVASTGVPHILRLTTISWSDLGDGIDFMSPPWINLMRMVDYELYVPPPKYQSIRELFEIGVLPSDIATRHTSIARLPICIGNDHDYLGYDPTLES